MPPLPPLTPPATAPPAANAPDEAFARRSDPPVAAAQSRAAGGAYNNFAESGRGSDGEPAAEPNSVVGLTVFSAVQSQPIQRRLSREPGAVRRRHQLPDRARQKAAAPAAGGEGSDRGVSIDGHRQRTDVDLQHEPAIHFGAARAVVAGPGETGRGEFQTDGRHQRSRATRPAT